MDNKKFVPGKGMVSGGKEAPVKKGAVPASKAGSKKILAKKGAVPAPKAGAKKAIPPKAPKKK